MKPRRVKRKVSEATSRPKEDLVVVVVVVVEAVSTETEGRESWLAARLRRF